MALCASAVPLSHPFCSTSIPTQTLTLAPRQRHVLTKGMNKCQAPFSSRRVVVQKGSVHETSLVARNRKCWKGHLAVSLQEAVVFEATLLKALKGVQKESHQVFGSPKNDTPRDHGSGTFRSLVSHSRLDLPPEWPTARPHGTQAFEDGPSGSKSDSKTHPRKPPGAKQASTKPRNLCKEINVCHEDDTQIPGMPRFSVFFFLFPRKDPYMRPNKTVTFCCFSAAFLHL